MLATGSYGATRFVVAHALGLKVVASEPATDSKRSGFLFNQTSELSYSLLVYMYRSSVEQCCDGGDVSAQFSCNVATTFANNR